MTSASENKEKSPWQLWMVIATFAVAIAATVFLTRPAANVMSMTPLSGLMTLKTMAADAMPYDVAVANQKPTLIEFYADWCTTCQSMSATVDALHQQYGTQVNFVMLDIDDPQWADEVEAFGASGVPQFTLLDVNRQSVHTWVGKVPKPIFQTAFTQMLMGSNA
ncbi:MAG: thioredoxin domain-containing protein [Cyanobacteria bacterium J06650_10]